MTKWEQVALGCRQHRCPRVALMKRVAPSRFPNGSVATAADQRSSCLRDHRRENVPSISETGFSAHVVRVREAGLRRALIALAAYGTLFRSRDCRHHDVQVSRRGIRRCSVVSLCQIPRGGNPPRPSYGEQAPHETSTISSSSSGSSAPAPKSSIGAEGRGLRRTWDPVRYEPVLCIVHVEAQPKDSCSAARVGGGT
jgi:hypothetical protein